VQGFREPFRSVTHFFRVRPLDCIGQLNLIGLRKRWVYIWYIFVNFFSYIYGSQQSIYLEQCNHSHPINMKLIKSSVVLNGFWKDFDREINVMHISEHWAQVKVPVKGTQVWKVICSASHTHTHSKLIAGSKYKWFCMKAQWIASRAF